MATDTIYYRRCFTSIIWLPYKKGGIFPNMVRDWFPADTQCDAMD